MLVRCSRSCLPSPLHSTTGYSSATAAALLPLVSLRSVAGNQSAVVHIFWKFAACHAGGMNVVLGDKSLQQEALEKYLTVVPT